MKPVKTELAGDWLQSARFLSSKYVTKYAFDYLFILKTYNLTKKITPAVANLCKELHRNIGLQSHMLQ